MPRFEVVNLIQLAFVYSPKKLLLLGELIIGLGALRMSLESYEAVGCRCGLSSQEGSQVEVVPHNSTKYE